MGISQNLWLAKPQQGYVGSLFVRVPAGTQLELSADRSSYIFKGFRLGFKAKNLGKLLTELLESGRVTRVKPIIKIRH